MREKLAKKNNQREVFTGVFIQFGTKRGYRHQETTVLLINIKDKDGNLMTDHLWFNYTKLFKRLWEEEKLHTGNIIEFNARVKPYTKGYEKDETDYKLSFSTKLKIIGEDPFSCKLKKCDPPFKYIKNHIYYSHPYYKFNDLEYTSVRGLDSLEYYELFQELDANFADEILHLHHSATIIKIEKRKISSLSLKFLKKDCEYPGFEIHSKSEFIDLINSLRRNKKSHVKLENDPEFAVYTFHKIIQDISKPVPIFSGFAKKTISLDKFIKKEN